MCKKSHEASENVAYFYKLPVLVATVEAIVQIFGTKNKQTNVLYLSGYLNSLRRWGGGNYSDQTDELMTCPNKLTYTKLHITIGHPNTVL